ncbi:H-NS histone family protein [Roseinatronobacter sp. S2]|uniref:H-NS histone family protein n=1 Tax=Roseinatronobacter sp. S2 TaxID=3035471 RepID=UPI00240FB9F5|nr:H-NS histone family protein [Roseinatronobacter sp. S2]WFE77184.1 H-NS histone family protein [Roseinatronobacter sp. S2]
MADFDLEALSLTDLRKLHKDIAKAITTYEERQKAEARAKVETFARELGYSLAELVSTATKITRVPVPPKYRHPENPALTWSGRGRKPLWFVEALSAGKAAEDMAIG